jgi:hypothetical protein
MTTLTLLSSIGGNVTERGSHDETARGGEARKPTMWTVYGGEKPKVEAARPHGVNVDHHV